MDSITLPLDTAHILIYIMLSITIIIEACIAIFHGKQQMKDIKGDNKRWDNPELLIVYFLPPSLTAVISDVFLHVIVPDGAYLFLAAGLGIGSATRGYVATRSNKPPDPPNKSEAI